MQNIGCWRIVGAYGRWRHEKILPIYYLLIRAGNIGCGSNPGSMQKKRLFRPRILFFSGAGHSFFSIIPISPFFVMENSVKGDRSAHFLCIDPRWPFR